ncbi:protein FAM71E2 [Fukomys damarensis]|uniref:protein FAM71E2 n=1 Tax=Fukomys damarensis TaxID=885580 RepID=UPI001455C0C9|nr:protein FAM71E2 [Fukomys damarensis]
MKRLWNTRPAQPRKGSAQWVPVLGNLQKTLQKGEHLPLRPLPMFESNFVQVTEVGSPVFLHHRANRVTMGVAASLPGLVLPDILLFARPRTRDDSCLELTRMIPLDFARLHIHDTSARRLKLRLVTGRCYYLDLEAPDREMSFLFDCWVRLAHLLQEPATAWAPWPLHPSGHDVLLAKVPASTWRLQDLAHGTQTAATQEPTFPHKRPPVQKPRKAKRRFQSRAVGDSVPLFWSQQDCADVRTKSTENRSAPSANPDRRDIQIHGSGKNSNTIRTIFSIISSTIHQACTPDSEEAPGREGLIATPSRCVSRDSSGLSRLGSIDSLEILLWQHEIEDFLAPESTTLSSSSLNTAPYSPALYLFPPCPSFSSPQDKARDVDSRLGQGPPPSQKALSSAGPQRGAPVIMDKPQRVPAVSGGPQKSPASAHPFQKALTVLSPPPQSPTVLPTCTGPQKAACPQGPEKEPLFLPTWSQQTPAPLPQPQAAPSPPALQGKPPTQLDMVLAGPPGADVTKRSKHEGSPGPRVLVGIQEMNVTEIRTQEVSLDLPFGTTTKESKEVLVSQAREVTLGGLWGQAKLEDTAHRRREEVLLDLPSVRSKEVEQQKTRVRTQQVAFKGPGQERSRAFSVEGLSMAKPMIMANSKEQCPWPAMASLPSRLAGTSQAGAMSVDIEVSVPWSPSQLSLLEDTRVVVRDQPESHPCGKEQAERQMDREPPRDSGGSSKGPLSPVPGSNSPMRTADPLVPIPLPASLWEDLPQPPLPPACSSGAKAPARVPQQLTRASQGPVRMPRPHSPATARSSSESILPVLLEIPSVRDVATQAQITKGDLRLLHPLASLQPSQRFQ